MNSKVKIFSATSPTDLENQINGFLDANPNIHIENILFSTTTDAFNVLILYSQTS